MATVRLQMKDQNDNILPCFNEGVSLENTGGIELIGPSVTTLRGGMGGTYVKAIAPGKGTLIIKNNHIKNIEIDFNVSEVTHNIA